MTMDLGTARSALATSAEALVEAGTRLRNQAEPRFGATGPGRLGDLGRDLSRDWQRAIDARAHEASAHAERLRDLADALARAGGRYGDVDTERQKAQEA
jgi:hypothetical protein